MGERVSFEQEVSYCGDCCGAWYPALSTPCPCNGKYRLIIKVSLMKALQICKLGEKSGKTVRIINGELSTRDRAVSEAGDGVAGNGDEPDILESGRELPGSGGEGAAGGVESEDRARGSSENND